MVRTRGGRMRSPSDGRAGPRTARERRVPTMPGISILVPGARARCPADEAAHGRISPDEAGTTRSGPGPPGGAPRRGTDDGTGEVSMTQEPHREDGADGDALPDFASSPTRAGLPDLAADHGPATLGEPSENARRRTRATMIAVISGTV